MPDTSSEVADKATPRVPSSEAAAAHRRLPRRRAPGSCSGPTRRRRSCRRCCCSPCSRCSPRWCCRCSAARRRCGRWPSSSSRRRCSPATATPIFSSPARPRATDRRHPSGRLPAGVPGAAHRPAGDLGRAAARRALSVAARALHRGHRAAVHRRVGQCAAAAGLVCPHRPSARARSLFPVRGQQSRQPDRAAGLSVRARAGVRAEGS